MTSAPLPLVLASASAARRQILSNAGLDFVSDPAQLDEAAIKSEAAGAGLGLPETALALAQAKAEAVAERRPGSLVIGADQMLDCGAATFDKPRDRAEARRQLRILRGQSHSLISAVVLVRDERCLWQHVEMATLTMRAFSDRFLERYLDRAGAEILQSVGSYRIEGEGIQLFARIGGDHFTILGLPLLPLLGALRREGVLEH